MPAVLLYMLKFSICISGACLFYWIALRRLTFYIWNRWYLLCYSLLSFVIPLVDIGPVVEKAKLREFKLIEYIPAMGNYAGIRATPTVLSVKAVFLNGWDLLLWGVASVSFFLFVRLILQFLSIWKMKKKANLIQTELGAVFQVDGRVSPFSFGNAVFLNLHLHNEEELKEIILHEYVHIRQIHSIDILVGELLCIVNWYNPFTWMIRYSIRQNLEYIADQDLLQGGIDRKAYQYHLLRVLGNPIYRITNHFNLASLKRRIFMMNVIRSARINLFRFLFVLPLVAFLLLSFRNPFQSFRNGKTEGQEFTEVGIFMDGLSLGQTQQWTKRNNVPSSYFAPNGLSEISRISIYYRNDSGGPSGFQDETSIERGRLFWKIAPQQPRNPLILVNGKKISPDSLADLTKKKEISLLEYASKGELLKKYGGEAEGGIVNLVTLSNKDQESAHIFPIGNSKESGINHEESELSIRRNSFFLNRENPIRISAMGSRDKELVIRIETGHGYIFKKKGVFLITPTSLGNMAISVFRKGPDGAKKWLTTRYFRIEDPAEL
jgi:hypothetical protein